MVSRTSLFFPIFIPVFIASPSLSPTLLLPLSRALSPFPLGSDALKLPFLGLGLQTRASAPAPGSPPAGSLSLPACSFAPHPPPDPLVPFVASRGAAGVDSAMPPSLLCRLGGVHRQLSCCSEMWRLLLRDRETSVPGPRGKKKKGAKKGAGREERKGGRREGRI